MGCPVLMYRVGGTAIPAPYTVYNTTRVDIHICVYTQEKGVGQELALVPIAAVMFRPRVRHRFSLQSVLLQGGSVIALIILTQLALTINGV